MNPLTPFDSQMQLLGKVLDLRAKSGQFIAANIANAETPGYSPSHLDFEQELSQALRKGKGLQLTTSNSRHIPLGPSDFHQVTGKIITENKNRGVGDENGVSVDQEMLELSRNELLYETAAQLLKKKSTMIKYAISGGQ